MPLMVCDSVLSSSPLRCVGSRCQIALDDRRHRLANAVDARHERAADDAARPCRPAATESRPRRRARTRIAAPAARTARCPGRPAGDSRREARVHQGDLRRAVADSRADACSCRAPPARCAARPSDCRPADEVRHPPAAACARRRSACRRGYRCSSRAPAPPSRRNTSVSRCASDCRISLRPVLNRHPPGIPQRRGKQRQRDQPEGDVAERERQCRGAHHARRSLSRRSACSRRCAPCAAAAARNRHRSSAAAC